MADTKIESGQNNTNSNKKGHQQNQQNNNNNNNNNRNQRTPGKNDNRSNSNRNNNENRDENQSKKRKIVNDRMNGNHGSQQSLNENRGGGGDDGRHEEPSSSSSNAKNHPQNHPQNSQHPHFRERDSFKLNPRLTGAPTWELPPQNNNAQQFTGRCRLFVANLPKNITEDMLRQLFLEFGQISDIYIGNQNQFSFIKMDTKQNAENARNSLDGFVLEGRILRVRLAAHAAAIKVSHLPPSCSNELLALAFSTFGPVERAVVAADDRGRSLNEGLVEFARKSSAQAAIKKCQNECMLLTSHPIPVVVTSLESRDEDEGVPEKNLVHQQEYRKDREYGPRYAEPGSVEYTIARKWKELYDIETARREEFDAEIREMHESFRAKMEYLRLEESIKQLREQMLHMDAQSSQLMEMERERHDNRNKFVHNFRQKTADIIGPAVNPNDIHALRRQETDLRHQADAYQGIMMQRQENVYRDPQQHPAGPQQPPPHPSMGGGYDNGPSSQPGGPPPSMGQGPPPPMMGQGPPPQQMMGHPSMGPPQPLFGPPHHQQPMHQGFGQNGPPPQMQMGPGPGPMGQPMGPMGPMGAEQWTNGPPPQHHVPVFQDMPPQQMSPPRMGGGGGGGGPGGAQRMSMRNNNNNRSRY